MLIEQYLAELQMPTKWRPRVEVYVLKDKKILVGTHPEIVQKDKRRRGLHVPGGGIEPGQDVFTAATNECLEEVGVKIKNIKLITKENYYEDWYKLDAEGYEVTKKDRERMKFFRGIKHHYVKADYDGIDTSLFGSANDALKRIFFVSKEELIKAYEGQGKVFDPLQYAFRIKMVKKL